MTSPWGQKMMYSEHPYLPNLLFTQWGEAVTLQDLLKQTIRKSQDIFRATLQKFREMFHQEVDHGLLQQSEVKEVRKSVQIQVIKAI